MLFEKQKKKKKMTRGGLKKCPYKSRFFEKKYTNISIFFFKKKKIINRQKSSKNIDRAKSLFFTIKNPYFFYFFFSAKSTMGKGKSLTEKTLWNFAIRESILISIIFFYSRKLDKPQQIVSTRRQVSGYRNSNAYSTVFYSHRL